MTAENFAWALRLFSSRRTFVPFVVELNTGFRLVIRHPEALVLRKDLAYYVRRDYYTRLFDASSVTQLCDLPFKEPAEPIDLFND
jgi:hypothetical protein